MEHEAGSAAHPDGTSRKEQASAVEMGHPVERMTDPDSDHAPIPPDAAPVEHGAGSLTKRDIMHNMKVMILLESIFATGSADMQMALQPLLAFLGASYKMAGFVQGLVWAGLLGNILSPYITRRFKYKKWYYFTVNMACASTILFLGMGLIYSTFYGFPHSSLLVFTIGSICAYYFINGFCALPHLEYMAGCIPASYRGRLFGISSTIGSILSLGALGLGGLILKYAAKPASFGYCFLLTWIIWAIGYSIAMFAREQPTPVEKSPSPWSKKMLVALWRDKPFLNYMVLWALANLTFGSLYVLIPVFGFRELQMAAYTSAVIAAIGNIAKIGVTTPAGFMIDRLGPKRVLPYAMAMIGLGYMICFFLRSSIGIYLSMAVLSLSFAVFYTCGTVLAVSLPSPENRAGHYSMQFILSCGYFSLGPMISGWIMDFVPFSTVCLGTGVIAIMFFPLTKFMLRSVPNDLRSLD